MTETLLSSPDKEVRIGFDRPFVIIGERINPTGRKILAEEMKAGDYSRVEADAIAQVEAGAHMLDVNAGIPLADEPAILAEAIKLVQSVTDVPLSIDSSIVAALESGLSVYQGKALVNSVTGEEERLETVLPLVAKYNAAVVAISNDETGISEDPDVRFEVAKKIVERAADFGISHADVGEKNRRACRGLWNFPCRCCRRSPGHAHRCHQFSGQAGNAHCQAFA
jgi:5-methyltetrahydrofolate--homocysteine methyltransferase